MISLPACVCIGLALHACKQFLATRLVRLLAVPVLTGVALFQIQQSTSFLYTGMNDLRECASFLIKLTPRIVWVNSDWDVQKLMFFSKYRLESQCFRTYEELLERHPDSMAAAMADSYLVYRVDPHLVYRDVSWGIFPLAVRSNAVLLTTIKVMSRGMFSTYDPAIYYVR